MNEKGSTKRRLGVRSCKIGRFMAGTGLVLVGAGLLGARIDVLNPISAFLTFGVGMLLIMLATVLLAIGLAISFERGSPMATGSWTALITCIVIIAMGARNFPTRDPQPAIHDLTTDVADPPAFVALVSIREADAAQNPPEYAGAETARLQQEAFPDLTTLQLGAEPAAVFMNAVDVMREMDWEVVAEDPAAGRIEATDTTEWFRFKDDVVVRIRAADGGTLVDVRSKSRVGRGDMGANAARIREFIARLQTKAS